MKFCLPLIAILACLGARLAMVPAAAQDERPGRVKTQPPTRPPLESVDITVLPDGAERLDLFLLIGQSNMKGRGEMPAEPLRDPRLVMMHIKDDQWYLARHPLHLTGDARTFAGADNAGVGPGLSFAQALIEQDARARIGLVPCAVGGSSIRLWQKGAKLYDETLRRAWLAAQSTAPAKGRIRAALWLQGEADARPEGLPVHEERLLKMIDDLRADLVLPELPFIACTIGEMGDPASLPDKAAMNQILLALPARRPHTACVDARDLKSSIGDNVHYDTAAQTEIGRRFAHLYRQLTDPPGGDR